MSRMYQEPWNSHADYCQQPSMADMETDMDMQVALLEERCLAFEKQAEAYASQVTELEMNVAELSGHLQVLQEDLENKSEKTRDLTDEVCEQNRAIHSLQGRIEDMHTKMERKETMISQLEDYLTAECRKREEAEEEFKATLCDKDSEITQIAHAREHDRHNLSMQLEEQSQLAQELTEMMRKELDAAVKERDMLLCELHGQQQMVCELQQVLNHMPKDCKERILELENKLQELEEENSYVREAAGGCVNCKSAHHSKADSWNGQGAEQLSSHELHAQLDAMFRSYEALAREFEDYRGKQNAMEFEFERRVATLQMALGAKTAQEGHVKSLKAQHSRLVSDLANERARCKGLEKHMLEVKGQLIAAESEITAIKMLGQSREEKLFKCERKIVQLNQENCMLLDEIQKLQDMGRIDSGACAGVAGLRNRAICLRSTLESTQQQAAGLKTGDRHQLAKLTGALGEAICQTNRMLLDLERCTLEDSSESGDSMDAVDCFGNESGSPVQPPYLTSTHMQDIEDELWAILERSGANLGHNNPKQRIQYHLRLKQEMEEMRKECVGLLKEKFDLEQCIRYLAARSRLPSTSCFPQDVTCSYPRPASDSISPTSLASSIHYSTPTGRQLLLRGSRGSATLGQNLSPYKRRDSMEDAIRRVQYDTVREARSLLHEFRGLKMCQARLKQCKHSLEKRILSKVSSVCEPVGSQTRAGDSRGVARTSKISRGSS